MQVVITASEQHRCANPENPFRGWGPKQTVDLSLGDLRFRSIAAPAGPADLERSHRLLKGLLEAASDGHRFPDRFHRRGENRRTSAELLEGEARDLGDHVIDRGLEAGRRFAGDVVEDLVEGVSNGEASGDLRDRKACGLAGEGGGPAHPGVHFNHHHIAVHGIDGELDVAAAGGDPDLADDRDRLVAQSLVFPIRQGLGRGHRDRVSGVNPHRVEVFDAADDHDVVGQIAHHLQFEFLPAQQGLLDQDLRNRACLQSALADRRIFLRVVSDPTAAAPQGEGGTDDAGKTADGGTHGLSLLQGRGDPGGTDPDADPFHRLLEQQAVFGFLNRLQIGTDQLDTETLQCSVLGQGHRQIQGGLPAHGRQQGVGTFPFDHLRHEIRGERLDVGPIRHVRIGHDRCRVGIDQDHLVSLGAESFAGLGSGVIELAGLADHDRA